MQKVGFICIQVLNGLSEKVPVDHVLKRIERVLNAEQPVSTAVFVSTCDQKSHLHIAVLEKISKFYDVHKTFTIKSKSIMAA